VQYVWGKFCEFIKLKWTIEDLIGQSVFSIVQKFFIFED